MRTGGGGEDNVMGLVMQIPFGNSCLRDGTTEGSKHPLRLAGHLPAASSRSLGTVAGCGGLGACADASFWATPPDLRRWVGFFHNETILGAAKENDRVYERLAEGTFGTVQAWPSLRAALELLHRNYRNFDPQPVWSWWQPPTPVHHLTPRYNYHLHVRKNRSLMISLEDPTNL
jgi:hypothetical protein